MITLNEVAKAIVNRRPSQMSDPFYLPEDEWLSVHDELVQRYLRWPLRCQDSGELNYWVMGAEVRLLRPTLTANGIENASAIAGNPKPFGDKTCKHGVTLGFDCEECFEEIRACGTGGYFEWHND